MSLRISTAWSYDEGISTLQKRQSDLSSLQTAMTTGKRISKPSDDPTGAARAERAFIAQQRIESNQRAVATSRSSMELAEGAMGQAIDRLQDARQTLVAAGDGSLSSGDRQAQVLQLRALRDQLLQIANQNNGAGGYIFGGQSPDIAPFVDGPGGVAAAAVGGRMQAATETMPLTIDGATVWLQARTGNGVYRTEVGSPNSGGSWISAGEVTDPAALTTSSYQVVFAGSPGSMTYSVLKDGAATAISGAAYISGQAIAFDGMSMVVSGKPQAGDTFGVSPSQASMSPFAALDDAITALSNTNASGSQVQQAVNSGLRDIDTVMSQFMAARSDAGAVLNRMDTLDNRNQDKALWAKTVQSQTEDADMVQVLSEFKNQQTGYQAALQSYAMVQRMSLLDFLK